MIHKPPTDPDGARINEGFDRLTGGGSDENKESALIDELTTLGQRLMEILTELKSGQSQEAPESGPEPEGSPSAQGQP